MNSDSIEIRDDTYRRSLIRQKPFSFDNAVIQTKLKYAHLKSRKSTVAQLRVGEELEFSVLRDHPVYTSLIEVYTKEHKSIGLLSAEYGIALSRLMNEGRILVRGTAAKNGEAIINLYLTVVNPTEETVVDNNDKLRFYEMNTKRLISIQQVAHQRNDELLEPREYFESILTKDFSAEVATAYDRVLFSISFYFDDDELFVMKNDNNLNKFVAVPNSVISYLFIIIDMFPRSGELFMKTYPNGFACCNNWNNYTIEIKRTKKGLMNVILYENRLLIGSSGNISIKESVDRRSFRTQSKNQLVVKKKADFVDSHRKWDKVREKAEKGDKEKLEIMKAASEEYKKDRDLDKYISVLEGSCKPEELLSICDNRLFELPKMYIKAKRFDEARRILTEMKAHPATLISPRFKIDILEMMGALEDQEEKQKRKKM